tara:strand:- start:681 stop:1046 length:366 start_codon:yes stop_codon:yes gene_type:complete
MLKLEKDINSSKYKNNKRHRASKHSEFHEEVSDLLQDACLKDSFVVEGREKISSLMNKKHGSFKTENDHMIYFFTRTVDKEKELTRFFIKGLSERIEDENALWGYRMQGIKECPCKDCEQL